MYGGLDISVSGMVAQRMRVEAIAANLASKDAVADSAGNANPFRRKIAILMPGDPHASTEAGRQMGVHVERIIDDQSDFRKVHDPGHPLADKEGYVQYPNIDPVMENVNLLEAARAYEANVAAAEASKAMVAQALRMISA